jgi:DNA-binding LacI/PurR family transcriptional regulator/signal transduction histidine kinase/CheY-like chemotaxis protein
MDFPDLLGDSYGTTLRDALDVACRQLDLNLYIVAGRWLEDPDPSGALHNKVYDWIHAEAVDGIIVLSTSLAAHAGSAAVSRLCARYAPLPLCGIGLAIEGVPSVIIDNRFAMRGVVEHLVREHGCRRPVFISGPPLNAESLDRLAACREVLDEHGLELPDERVCSGDFLRSQAETVVHSLLARGVEFDAVIAANDAMALGALAALRKHGRRVPRDIMVTGFDDVHEVALASPPMTTARQPLRAMANLALRIVLDQLAGHRVELVHKLPTELVIRRSCGCGGRQLAAGQTPGAQPAGSAIDYLVNNADRLVLATERIFEEVSPAVSRRVQRLMDGLRDELAGHKQAFIDTLEDVLEELVSDNRAFQQLQEVVTLLREELRPFVTSELEDLWHDARCSIMLTCTRAQVIHGLDVTDLYTRVMQTANHFSTALRHVPEHEEKNLPFPGSIAKSAFVSRLVGGEREELEPWLFVFESRWYRPPLSRFSVHHLIPGMAYPDNRRHTSLVLPLVVDLTVLGLAVFEFSPHAKGHEILRDQLATALSNHQLHEEVLKTTTLHERSVQERLATARRMQSLSVLAGGVAHDLNNALGPLVALPDVILAGFDTAMAGDQEASAELRADIEAIKLASLRASRTIKDLLTLGRQGRTEKGLVDLNLVVLDSLPRNSARFAEGDERSVNFSIDSSPEALWVDGSEPHLVRAVTNLVRNAMEAIPGQGTIAIKTFAVTTLAAVVGFEAIEPGNYAVVSISDTGTGIPDSEMGQVFEPFYSRKKLGNESGSGLGLAIVHGVVKEHGGYVDIQSEVGRGTTFFLYFPRAAAALVPTRVRSSPAPLRHARILVVDDELVQLRTSRRILISLGYEVETCGSGAEALAQIDAALSSDQVAPRTSGPYDLIILDMVLHEDRDGLEVLDAIREMLPEQRAIIVSGHAPTERIERALAAGLIWLPKPYTKAELENTVRRALARPASHTPSAGGSIRPRN